MSRIVRPALSFACFLATAWCGMLLAYVRRGEPAPGLLSEQFILLAVILAVGRLGAAVIRRSRLGRWWRNRKRVRAHLPPI